MSRGGQAGLALLALALAGGAAAQDRPDEDAMFGGEPDAGTPATVAAPAQARPDEDALFGGEPDAGAAPASQPDDRDSQVLAGPPIQSQFDSQEAKVDPLVIGGQFYFRGVSSYAEETKFKDVSLSAPTYVDGYFDARPTDRLRAFVDGRLVYDATIDTTRAAGTGNLMGAEGGLSPSALALLTGQAPQNPRVLLDQAWINFDIAHAAFVTIGKQHVKWGASRFWNPTDFLSPEQRNPLLMFDPRVGTTMVKVHVPWEARGWNFYAMGLLENPAAADTLGKVGGAVRAETVFWQSELGMDAVFQLGRRPRFGIDFSSALGPFDVYGEVALRNGTDQRLWRAAEHPIAYLGYAGQWESYSPSGPMPAASGGLTYTFAYRENDTATIGAEYFFNSAGYDDPEIYPWLILSGAFHPFYTGKQYAAAYLLLPGPGDWNHTTFVGSTLVNISDGSALSRVDVSHQALSYLALEAFFAVHYGTKKGEFRFAADSDPMTLPNNVVIPAIHIPAPVFELGAGVRINI